MPVRSGHETPRARCPWWSAFSGLPVRRREVGESVERGSGEFDDLDELRVRLELVQARTDECGLPVLAAGVRDPGRAQGLEQAQRPGGRLGVGAEGFRPYLKATTSPPRC